MTATATVPLHTLAARLADAGVYGAFARHLLRVAPDVAVPIVGDPPSAFAVGGRMHGRFEVGFAWVFSEDVGASAALVDRIASAGGPWSVYVPHDQRAALVARFGAPECDEDLLLVCEVAPAIEPSATIVALDAETPRERFDPSIAERLPPPAIWRRFGFAYHGLEHDGRIVAGLETTVTDGRSTAIQQVFTAPDMRGRGLGHALLTGVCRDLVTAGKRPVYVCAADNRASEALAKSAGFELRMRLGCLEGR
jgi:GNAT superfamily N-acetyltransferase